MGKRKHADRGAVERAQRAADALVAGLVAAAKKDIAFVRRRRPAMAEAFYEIGEALVRLKRREAVAAMRCRSFAELCEAHVGLSSSQADRLVDIVTNMSRADAMTLGATRAASIVALARAASSGVTPADLLRSGFRRGGKTVDVKEASVRVLSRLAVEARAPSTRSRRAPTAEERAACAELQRALRASGALDATVTPKSGLRAGEARATIELAVADLGRLAQAARGARRRVSDTPSMGCGALDVE